MRQIAKNNLKILGSNIRTQELHYGMNYSQGLHRSKTEDCSHKIAAKMETVSKQTTLGII